MPVYILSVGEGGGGGGEYSNILIENFNALVLLHDTRGLLNDLISYCSDDISSTNRFSIHNVHVQCRVYCKVRITSAAFPTVYSERNSRPKLISIFTKYTRSA